MLISCIVPSNFVSVYCLDSLTASTFVLSIFLSNTVSFYYKLKISVFIGSVASLISLVIVTLRLVNSVDWSVDKSLSFFSISDLSLVWSVDAYVRMSCFAWSIF